MAFQTALSNRDFAHNQQKQQYDKRVKHIPYVSGDLVWLNDPTTSKQKLAPHWKGPFVVQECLGSDVDSPGVTYKIRYLLDDSGRSQIVHYNRLRPYTAPVPDINRGTPAGSSAPPNLPTLTALSGALPFASSRNMSTGGSVMTRENAVSFRMPQPLPQSQPQPRAESQCPPPVPGHSQAMSCPSNVTCLGGGLNAPLRSSRHQVRIRLGFVVVMLLQCSVGFVKQGRFFCERGRKCKI